MIVPDGTLATLNFETLVVPGASPHYWINDVTVSNAVSVAALTRNQRSLRAPEDLLAIGDPVDKSGSPALAHANEEIKLVSSSAPAAAEVVITGKNATPSAYASSHPERFRRIHFAAHGISNQIKPLESAILLSPDGENSTSLYGYDIVKHKLTAELVVISSCKGAEGRIYGEGSVGLAWAFMKAGAHQVIAALWNLDDAAAAELMKTFYDALNSGKSPAAALRAAKLSLMKDSNHRGPITGRLCKSISAHKLYPTGLLEGCPGAILKCTMSVADNKRLLETIFSQLALGNSRPFVEAMADDFSWTVTGTTKWSKKYAGKAVVLSELFGTLSSRMNGRIKTIPDRFIAEDDHVVVEAHGSNTTKSGKPYNNRYCFVFRVSDGKLKEVTEYLDTELVSSTLAV